MVLASPGAAGKSGDMKWKRASWWIAALLCGASAEAVETRKMMLSGNGPADAVEWDFTVTGGRRAGEKARIPVPSQWEQHGFGNYDYGQVPDDKKHKEDGIYQKNFRLPDAWKGQRVRIVFDGVMTDTAVLVNGSEAGPVHQGGFYRFHHDITDKISFSGDNRLEVRVSKDSANPTIEGAERGADFWVFGGIYRPVWLEALPLSFIDWTGIDAKADGSLRVKVHPGGDPAADAVEVRVMEKDGTPLDAKPLRSSVAGSGPIEINGRVPGVKPWSAEEPNLYQIEIRLMKGETELHRVVERVGFRTMETRPGQGVFVNGRRVTIKGVNRHCFRPESGRALDPIDSVEDVKLIRSMNMNAVRCSHYPPDKAFLDACDEIGLYVESELCTWQKPVIDTENARRLIGQMIRRDGNHPSILWWANGNEGGWNTEVDGEYALHDIQARPVLHPWEEFSGYQTKHYPVWERLQKDLAGPHLVMPTEFLHGLYDGGHGAGLEDYWNAITSRPNGVGGFLWVLADEGIMRTDRGGEIDNQGILAPDGIVGPHHEKEASYHTIKDIFCPVEIRMRKLPADFDGRIPLRNGYDFRNLREVRFAWKWAGDASPRFKQGPDLEAGESGVFSMDLPSDWKKRRSLELRADDQDGHELWTWCWEVPGQESIRGPVKAEPASEPVRFEAKDGVWTASAKDGLIYQFDAASGRLAKVTRKGDLIEFSNGPRLVGADAAAPAATTSHRMMADGSFKIDAASEGPLKSFSWTVHPDGALDLDYLYQIDSSSHFHGITFDMPQAGIVSFDWEGQGPERVWANRMRGTRFGSFTKAFHLPRPGVDYSVPPAAGYYAGVDRFSVKLRSGRLDVFPGVEGGFVRIGTNQEGEKITTWWPEGDFSVLHAIPPIGNKFDTPDRLGPQSQAHPATGEVRGSVRLIFTGAR